MLLLINNKITMYFYKTNTQAHDEVMQAAREHEKIMLIANELFPSEVTRVNLIGLSEDQRNEIYSKL